MEDSNILNHKSFGKGNPVFILHGLFGMLDNWQTFAKKLSQDHQVITVDMRNHGRSFHNPDASYRVMAEDVIHLANHLKMDHFSLLGHSMGGKVACELALHYPKRVNNLIAVDILPVAYHRGHDKVLNALNALHPAALTTRKEAEVKMLDLLDGDLGTTYFLLKSIKRNNNGGFEWRFNLPVLEKEYESIRGGISEGLYEDPVLFIKGGDSDYVTVDRWIEVTSIFPNAELLEIDGAGHWVHVDKMEELLQATESFLTK